MISISLSSAAKLRACTYSGHLETMMDSSADWSEQKISSVMNGMYGCRSFSASISTLFSVHSAAFCDTASSEL